MTGQIYLGKYKVLRQLDEGGMSKIFLARQLDADREVVVKVLKESLLIQPKTVEHFRREIHIMSRFQHANAVACYDSAPNERPSPVLVLEYLRGIDLNLLIQKQGRFAPDRAGRLLVQLCDALQAAHDAGIVHRDVKPGNCMIQHPGTPQEALKLMDFGLARMKSMLYITANEVLDARLPAAAGTPEYISPEQVRGQEMDHRGDLYSVGAIAFELLTGRRVFEYTNVKELLRAHVEEPPPRFADLGLGDAIPPEVESVVQACLAKTPEQRPQSALELAQRYEHALGKKLTPLRRSGQVPVLKPTPTPSKPVPLVSAAERHAIRQSFDVDMPEAMAMLKVKGFIHDLGGAIVETVPGLIRVRLADPKAAEAKKPGLFGWMDRSKSAPPLMANSATELELSMERKDPDRSSRLTIALVMRPANRSGLITPEWRTRCNKIGRDLGAYLMGR